MNFWKNNPENKRIETVGGDDWPEVTTFDSLYDIRNFLENTYVVEIIMSSTLFGLENTSWKLLGLEILWLAIRWDPYM